jgi:hypothetical protein
MKRILLRSLLFTTAPLVATAEPSTLTYDIERLAHAQSTSGTAGGVATPAAPAAASSSGGAVQSPPTAPAAPSSGGFGAMLLGLLSSSWEYVLTLLLSIPVIATLLTAQRKKLIADATFHAFWAVEDAVSDADIKSPIVDKAGAGLKIANQYMLDHGWRGLKPGEVDATKTVFKSMNAQLDAQTKGSDSPSSAPSPK